MVFSAFNVTPYKFMHQGEKGLTFLRKCFKLYKVTSLRACSSVGRALRSHRRGQGFEYLLSNDKIPSFFGFHAARFDLIRGRAK